MAKSIEYIESVNRSTSNNICKKSFSRPFFDACDGIFLNYTWQTEMLLQSRLNAGERYRDVFVGIDVFGRGCFGGGGFNTCEVR